MYLSWNKKIITEFDDDTIESAYNHGYVFVRTDKGDMNQTRSLRIDLRKFELSSENRRVLKKTENLISSVSPIPYTNYTWQIHKMGKGFYEKKFGKGIFSAQKIKELITDKTKSNFNRLLVYGCHCEEVRQLADDEAIPRIGSTNNENSECPGIAALPMVARNDNVVGYCICLETKDILHYCYPFYDLESNYQNIGIGMMLKAVVWAKENNKKHIYLGSFQRPSDIYKLQFSGLEWFDGKKWQTNLEKLKKIYV